MSWFPVWMNFILRYPKCVSTETLQIIRAKAEPSAPLITQKEGVFQEEACPLVLRGCDLTFTGDRDVMPSLMESSLSPSAIHSRSLGRILPPCDKILQGSSITTNFLHCFFSKGVLLFLKELLRYTIQRYYIAPLPRDCPLLSGPLNFLKVLFSKSFNHLCGKKLSSHAFLSHSG